MTLPQKPVVGATYQKDPPSEREIFAVRAAQNLLRQAGLDFAADNLDTYLSRPVWVCEQVSCWSLKPDEVTVAKDQAARL